MTLAFEARKLADYISNLESFETYHVDDQFCYEHIGALFTDIILQSGLNYNTVVKPRVNKVLVEYSDATTTHSFQELINEHGLEKLIKWDHPVKINRFLRLMDFAFENNINTCSDFKHFMMNLGNREKLLNLNGIGPKTIDYTLKLLNFDTVAVDRHIYSFVELADIKINGYDVTKRIVEYAADFLQISRSSMDYSIWKYMSNGIKSYPNLAQV
jgi:hypothetical protein